MRTHDSEFGKNAFADFASVGYKMRTTKEILGKIHAGWNLGNSFDCFRMDYSGNGSGETEWGNPIVTDELLDAVRNKGFDMIRIPTTWHERYNSADGWNVDPAFFARVQSVVDSAIKKGFIVILNVHHDNSWLFRNDAKDPELLREYTNLWRQIAERFRDYPDTLFFEALNEPRIENTPLEWKGETAAVRDKINFLQDGFFHAVRESGGNNVLRTLLVTTPGATITEPGLKDLMIPGEGKDENVGVSLHIYQPQDFCLEVKGNRINEKWDGSQNEEIRGLFRLVEKYLASKQIPAVLTEYGATDKGNDKEVAAWVRTIHEEAYRLGISCVWWDNGTREGREDSFCVIDRKNLSWQRPETVREILNCDTL